MSCQAVCWQVLPGTQKKKKVIISRSRARDHAHKHNFDAEATFKKKKVHMHERLALTQPSDDPATLGGISA